MRIPFMLIAVLSAGAMQSAPFELSFLDSFEIETGFMFEGQEFGGISGLDRLEDGTYIGISDNRGSEELGAPRFYTLDIDYTQDGFKDVSILSSKNLQRADGTDYPTRPTTDPEAIRLDSDGTLYWSSEGNYSDNADDLYQPSLTQMNADGSVVRMIDTPVNSDYVDNETLGVRNNGSYEALAVTDSKIFLGNEFALRQDDQGLRRITQIDKVTGDIEAQYSFEAYEEGFGLVDLMWYEGNTFIAVERSFVRGVGNTIVLSYLTFESNADNVLADLILDGSAAPVTKEVLAVFGPEFAPGLANDNIESISFGHTLENGNRTIILASDNNFNPNGQRNLFVAMEIVEPSAVPVPASLPLAMLGIAGLAVLRRRK